MLYIINKTITIFYLNRRTYMSGKRIVSLALAVMFIAYFPISYSYGANDPWGSNHHASDSAKNNVQNITTAPANYSITQGGTMDGDNCSVLPCMWPWTEPGNAQTWESNRSVRMENTGTVNIVNPWLSNGRSGYRNKTDLVNAVTSGLSTNREKCNALYSYEMRCRYHSSGGPEVNTEICDPISVSNVYGYNTCGNSSLVMACMWGVLGLSACPGYAVGHCISQVYYDGRWNFYDADMQNIELLRDNQTVSNQQEFTRDPDLMKRTHQNGWLASDGRGVDEQQAAIFLYDGPNTGSRSSNAAANMDMTLRPGEALEWRWGHETPLKHRGSSTPDFPDQICNGLWEYAPNLAGSWQSGADTVTNITTGGNGLQATSGQTGTIIWKITTPYPFVGGQYAAVQSGAVFHLSFDKATWTAISANFDASFPSNGTSYYTYYLRCQLTGAAYLTSIDIKNDIQMAPLALPGLKIGTNNLTYTDQNTSGRNVRITTNWVERSATNPPTASSAPIYPTNGGNSNGTKIVFQWQPATDSDGTISDYHFQLSERSDMKWVLSSNFEKLVSKTSDSGNARLTLPYDGMLTPGRTYYWRVQAKDNSGVWGPWSTTWSFTAGGSDYPINVAMDYNDTTKIGTLRWNANPNGSAPAKYRVYGSDEKGFTVSDVSYNINLGGTTQFSNPRPANFVAETTNNYLDVIGVGNALPNANKAYYRVVAVDSSNNRSWSSDYAEAPRGYIYSSPTLTAQAGVPYSYQCNAIKSLGALKYKGGGHAFWDIENLKYSIVQGDWVTINEDTGLMTGTPSRNDTIIVKATCWKPYREYDLPQLMWGGEYITNAMTVVAGTMTQTFNVTVSGQINDTTPPTNITAVRDGTGADLDLTEGLTQFSANWDASTDPDSGVTYRYAIGTTAGGTDFLGWTFNAGTSVTKTNLTLIDNQKYYVSVKAVNGAGLESSVTTSDGIIVRKPLYIFHDDFDSWSAKPGAWDSANGETASHIINTTTEQKFNGTKSLKVTDNDSAGTNGAYLLKTFTPGLTADTYVRFYFFIPTGFGATGGSRDLVKITNVTTYLMMGYSGANGPFIHDSPSWRMVKQPAVTENRWYCFEVRLTPPSSNTTIDMWLDGVLLGSLTGKNFGNGAWNSIQCGDYAELWGTTGVGSYYIDELAVADHYIGAYSTFTDITPPSTVTVNDGTGADLDYTNSTSQLSANWTASTDNECSISYYKYAIGTTAGGTNTLGWTSLGNVRTVTKTGLSLSAGTTYYFSVKAANTQGLESVPGNSDGICVSGTGVVQNPPVVTNVNAVNITAIGATINWTTDKTATSRVFYGETASYGNSTTEDTNLVTNHSVGLTGLTVDKTYHYKVVSKDGSGNTGESADGTFKTSASPEIVTKTYPNPFVLRDGANMTFSINNTSGGYVEIYTISGRFVNMLQINAGQSDAVWNLNNVSGTGIKPGIYVYVIKDNNGSKKSGKIVITK
jgi:hypothetical protein